MHVQSRLEVQVDRRSTAYISDGYIEKFYWLRVMLFWSESPWFIIFLPICRCLLLIWFILTHVLCRFYCALLSFCSMTHLLDHMTHFLPIVLYCSSTFRTYSWFLAPHDRILFFPLDNDHMLQRSIPLIFTHRWVTDYSLYRIVIVSLRILVCLNLYSYMYIRASLLPTLNKQFVISYILCFILKSDT